MTARCVPEEPRFSTESERRVWTQLRDDLGPDDVLLANVRLTDEQKDHEADLVVLMPDYGVATLEIKGGSVWFGDDGWRIRRGDRIDRIHPVDQARDSKHALRRYVEHDPRWGSRGRVSWAHGVATPHAGFDDDFAVPELPRWALHDRSQLSQLAERVRDSARRMSQGCRIPGVDDVDLIAEILAGRHHTAYDAEAEALERADVADRLTQEQAMILRVTRLLDRVEVRGGAGSGKTWLALQQAKELSRGASGRGPQRVALLCYSIGLATFLKRQVETWPRQHRPKFVGTWEEFGRQWGAPPGTREDSDFWEHRLPALMAELAEQLPPGQRYDSVIVDEAQDFARHWWDPVVAALKDPETGGIYAYSDENQRIFGRFGAPPMPLVPLVLDDNLRNTKQIHQAFGPLAPSRMRSRGGDGVDVRFVTTTVDDALDTADDEVVALLDEGWEPGSVCLLTTGHRHPEQVALTERYGQEGYWRQFWEGDDVFFGHVLGSKGLERRAVVLCLNERHLGERSRERLYVGMSRATDVLVVVGDPAQLREIGGADVARRLGVG